MNNNIGIITWYHSINYGSQLQAYALSRVLNRIGFNAYMLTSSHYPIAKNATNALLYHSVLKKILLPFIRDQKELFVKTHLREFYLNYKHPSFYNFKSIICGSDQIWAPSQFKPYYMLSTVPDKVNKISYAASIGFENIPDDLVNDYKKYIGRINHVSVREDKGKELLEKKCGIEATVVLDPTLLVDKKEWDLIKREPDIKRNYIFCYFLKQDHQYSSLVKDFAKQKELSIIGVSDNTEDASWMQLLSHQQVGPCEFIGLIEGAKAVITDSYHGTIFSMLYHKPFILFERFNKEDIICQNSRIEQLKKYFGIDNRIVNPNLINQLDITPIDYSMFESSLTILREKSMRFLKNALL